MSDLTVHITIPRREWPADKSNWNLDIEEADRNFGRAVREEAYKAIEKLEARSGSRPDMRTIEITFVDTAYAEIEDDPTDHTP